MRSARSAGMAGPSLLQWRPVPFWNFSNSSAVRFPAPPLCRTCALHGRTLACFYIEPGLVPQVVGSWGRSKRHGWGWTSCRWCSS